MRREKRLALLIAAMMATSAIGCGDDGTDPGVDGGLDLDASTMDGGTLDAGADDAGTDGGSEHVGDITMGRLVVSSDTGGVEVFDLDEDDPELLETFSVTSAAKAYGDINGRMVYLVQRGSNLVNVLQSGVIFESHVDHYHITEGAPEMLEFTLTGDLPTHFTHHDGWIAAFYDGSGDVDVMQERTLLADSPVVTTLATGNAHHGIGVVANAHLLASVNPEAGDFPNLPPQVGIWSVTELEGEAETTASPCPNLHGEAAAGEFVAFGCSDGILVVESHDDHFHVAKLDNPEGTIEGTRTSFLAAHENSATMWGTYGDEGYVIIDPEEGTVEATLTDAAMSRAFGFDMAGEHMFILTIDGMLHRFEADGEQAGEPLQIMDAFTPVGGPTGTNPAFAAGAGRIYISIPADGQVVEVHVEDFEVERTISVTGTPHSIAVVSVSPDYSEEGHTHEH